MPFRNSKNYGTVTNLLILAVVALCLYVVFKAGQGLQESKGVFNSAESIRNITSFDLRGALSFEHPLSILILQILVIIVISRVFAWI
ncbi:MAG: hypothetical protein ACM3ME_06850, partial [Chloroflexota bacterium]